MNAVGLGATILAGGAIIASFGAWFYAAFNMLAAFRAYWRSMPSFGQGLREIFWPDITDAAKSLPPPPAFIIYRNKARRGAAVFFITALFAMAIMILGAAVGGWHGRALEPDPHDTHPPAKDQTKVT